MKKFLKLIVTSMLAFVMLTGTSLPIMAAELPEESMIDKTMDTSNVSRSGSLIAQYDCKRGTITQGTKLDPVYLSSQAKTIKFCADGLNGILVIRLKNQSTGDSRSFTAVGDGRWGEITYIAYMDAGTYDVSVEYADGLAHTRLRMEFYN